MPHCMMCCLMGADPHFEINGTDVSTCEKTVHLGNVQYTTNKYEMVFDGIKKLIV